MKILVDVYTSEIPKDVVEMAPKLETSGPIERATRGSVRKIRTDPSEIEVFTPPDLDRWDAETHTYKDESAKKVGFLAGLFSGSEKSVAAGLVHEVKKYRVDKTNKGREIEIGVSVRLSIATTAYNAEFDFSIPNLAAQAQLGMSEARVGIYVVGYFGPIGDLLPAPDDLNVENFSIYTKAAKEIQNRVFGLEGIGFMTPKILSFEN